MTREEAITDYIVPAIKRTWNDKKCKEILEALEQEPCEDEYIKVPKKALKYRTAGMVAYNAEWLKNHFDIERAVICGTQEPSGDLISRDAVISTIYDNKSDFKNDFAQGFFADRIRDLPPVNPQEPKWIPVSERLPEEDTNVLCWYEYFRYGNYNKMYQTYGIGTYFGRFGWAGDITGEQARVIAWMPLPEPYKAGSED